MNAFTLESTDCANVISEKCKSLYFYNIHMWLVVEGIHTLGTMFGKILNKNI